MRAVGILFILLLSCGNISSVGPDKPWGFFAHRKINHLAIFSVPDPLHDFLRKHIDFITEHAVDPDKRRHAVKNEAERHYIDLDHYNIPLEHILDSFPLRWDDAVARYTEDTLRAYGIAPWNAMVYYHRMVGAFRVKDTKRLLQAMADFGHYVGDMHVPLHTTENYNGQLTGQDGIHGFWESRLPELFFEEYALLVDEAIYVQQPLQLLWNVVMESHRNMPIVLEEERVLAEQMGTEKYTYEQRGESTIKTYSKSYAQAYHENLNGMVEQRLEAAIFHLACLWYSAWVDAGQPDMDTFK